MAFQILPRHPDLKKGLSRSLELARYAAASSEIYEDHFNKYKAACEKYGIADADKWNADEKGYRISLPSKELIILPREIREGRVPFDENREWSTTIDSASPAGEDLPKFVIIAAKVRKAEWMMVFKDKYVV